MIQSETGLQEGRGVKVGKLALLNEEAATDIVFF